MLNLSSAIILNSFSADKFPIPVNLIFASRNATLSRPLEYFDDFESLFYVIAFAIDAESLPWLNEKRPLKIYEMKSSWIRSAFCNSLVQENDFLDPLYSAIIFRDLKYLDKFEIQDFIPPFLESADLIRDMDFVIDGHAAEAIFKQYLLFFTNRNLKVSIEKESFHPDAELIKLPMNTYPDHFDLIKDRLKHLSAISDEYKMDFSEIEVDFLGKLIPHTQLNKFVLQVSKLMNLDQFHAFNIIYHNGVIVNEQMDLSKPIPRNKQFRAGSHVVFEMIADPNEIENRKYLNGKIEKKLIQLEKGLEFLVCTKTKKGKFLQKGLKERIAFCGLFVASVCQPNFRDFSRLISNLPLVNQVIKANKLILCWIKIPQPAIYICSLLQ